MVVHQCNWCEYSTSRRANLTRHTRKHTGERPFSCSVCPYKAADESSIVAHIRTHTGERPFKCTICDYKASQAAHLRTHLRTHTGERPYPCTLCSYRATTDSALTVHMKVHSDERPFSCTVCSFTSKTKSRMSEHMKIHNKAKDAISESQLSGRLVYEQVAPGQQRFSPPLSGAAHTMDALRHVFDVNASPRGIHPNTADQEQARQLDQTLFFGSMGFSPAQIKVAKAGEMRLEVLTEVPNPQTAGQIPLTPPDKSDSESSSTSPLKSNPGWYF